MNQFKNIQENRNLIENERFNMNNIKDFLKNISNMQSNNIVYLNNFQEEENKIQNSNIEKFNYHNIPKDFTSNEYKSKLFAIKNNINYSNYPNLNNFPYVNNYFPQSTNISTIDRDKSYFNNIMNQITNINNLPIENNSIFHLSNRNEKSKYLNVILHNICSNSLLGKDFGFLNQKLLQGYVYLKNLEDSMIDYVNYIEKINISIEKFFSKEDINYINANFHIVNNTNFNSQINNSNFNNSRKNTNKNFNNYKINFFNEEEKINADICKNTKNLFLKIKRKKPDSEKIKKLKINDSLHFRPKRDYELKKKRIPKLKIFKIEKINKNKKIILRKGSKKYILKRIQYCWKSYFVKFILNLIPKRYEVIISKKFYIDHTKVFYLQLFKRLNTVKDLIADIVYLKKREKSFIRRGISIKNMGEFIKDFEMSSEIKANNYKLLDKMKMKNLSQTIKMNMIKYFRSKNYKRRIELYNCKKYDEIDLLKFRKPIKFFYSFVFKDFKFLLKEHETKRSIFYIDSLMKKQNLQIEK